jgi:hypothetical protein
MGNTYGSSGEKVGRDKDMFQLDKFEWYMPT